MPKSHSCVVCAHKSARAINRRLTEGETAQSVAKAWGINPRTMQRHFSGCIQQVVKAVTTMEEPALPAVGTGELVPLTQKELAIGADVVYRMADLQAKTLALLDSIPVIKVSAACAVIREARQNYALIARLTGKLNGASEEGARTITFQEFRILYQSVQQQNKEAM